MDPSSFHKPNISTSLTMKTTFFFLTIVASTCMDTARATKMLNQESFQKFKESGNNGIIKFYQDWCGHCKRMKPDWDALANEFGDVIMDVDCGDQKELCSNNDVTGYPTIKVFKDGEQSPYNGARSYDDLSNFVIEELLPKCLWEEPSDATCSPKAIKFINKWKNKTEDERQAEITRLNGLGNDMGSELKKWVKERIRILRQSVRSDEKTEL